MRSYQAARGTFTLVELMAWAAIILGGLIAILGASAAARGGAPGMLLGSLPGAGFALMGLFCRVYVQTARATVDCAEYAQQTLQVSRSQLEQHKQLVHLSGGLDTAPSFAEAAAAPVEQAAKVAPSKQPEASLLENYSGTTIKRQDDGTFLADNRSFDTLIDAKLAIDGDRLRASLQEA